MQIKRASDVLHTPSTTVIVFVNTDWVACFGKSACAQYGRGRDGRFCNSELETLMLTLSVLPIAY